MSGGVGGEFDETNDLDHMDAGSGGTPKNVSGLRVSVEKTENADDGPPLPAGSDAPSQTVDRTFYAAQRALDYTLRSRPSSLPR